MYNQPEIQQLMLSKIDALAAEINSLRELISQGKPELVAKEGVKSSSNVARIRKCKTQKDFIKHLEEKYK